MRLATGALQPPPEGGCSEAEKAPAPEESSQPQLGAAVPDALTRGTCDMTGGSIFWHSKLDEVLCCVLCAVMQQGCQTLVWVRDVALGSSCNHTVCVY